MTNRLINWIKNNKVLAGLFVLNFLTSLVAFYLGNIRPFADADGYWLAAEGLGQGNFSSWYSLGDTYPETLRTPGYSLFILIFKSIYDERLFVKLIQFLFYFMALLLAFKLVEKLSNYSKLALTIFLSITAVNIQVPYYVSCISSEIPCVFFTILFMYILLLKKRNYKNAILLGLVGGVIFLIRPAFLLFPILLTGYVLLFDRKSIKYIIIHLFVFILTLIPFTVWNYNAHNIVKTTPIDGAVGAAHLGYWYFKLPLGYQERFHWGNVVVSDLTNPIPNSTEQREINRVEYEKEWRTLIESLEPLLTKEDLINLEIMESDTTPNIFLLYNSEYTIARSEGLKRLLFENISKNPWYYAKTRMYTFFREYYTGINKVKYDNETSLEGKLKILYPFLVSFTFVLLGLLFSAIYILFKRGKVGKELVLLLFLAIYQGAAYIPFTIQSRYTIPVHFCIFILTAVFLSKIIHNRQKNIQ